MQQVQVARGGHVVQRLAVHLEVRCGIVPERLEPEEPPAHRRPEQPKAGEPPDHRDIDMLRRLTVRRDQTQGDP